MVTFLCITGELGPGSRPQAEPNRHVGHWTVKGRELWGGVAILGGVEGASCTVGVLREHGNIDGIGA